MLFMFRYWPSPAPLYGTEKKGSTRSPTRSPTGVGSRWRSFRLIGNCLTFYLPMVHWGNKNVGTYLLGPICVHIYHVFCFCYNCLPILHCSIICSLHVSSYGLRSVPTKQENLILSHFKLVLVNG